MLKFCKAEEGCLEPLHHETVCILPILQTTSGFRTPVPGVLHLSAEYQVCECTGRCTEKSGHVEQTFEIDPTTRPATGLLCGGSCCITWPHLHTTRLQPLIFSTGLLHFGHVFVNACSQLVVSLSPLFLTFQAFHISHVQGE